MDFHHWEKSYPQTWKIMITLGLFEITNQLLTCHSLYLVAWMNGARVFSFWNLTKVSFFLLVNCLYNKLLCSNWYLTSECSIKIKNIYRSIFNLRRKGESIMHWKKYLESSLPNEYPHFWGIYSSCKSVAMIFFSFTQTIHVVKI